jgi:hypothetical protein
MVRFKSFTQRENRNNLRKYHETANKKASSGGVSDEATTHIAFSNVLLSHAVTHAVPSAPRGLTTVVGMETGGPPSL